MQPDIYDYPNPLNPNAGIPGWSAKRYIETWNRAAEGLIKKLNFDVPHGPRFQAGVIADPFNAWIWGIRQALVDGLQDSAAAKYIKTWSVHQYFVSRLATSALLGHPKSVFVQLYRMSGFSYHSRRNTPCEWFPDGTSRCQRQPDQARRICRADQSSGLRIRHCEHKPAMTEFFNVGLY